MLARARHVIQNNENLLGYTVGQNPGHHSLPVAAARGGAQNESLPSQALRPSHAPVLPMNAQEGENSSMRGVYSETPPSAWDDDDLAEIDFPNQPIRSLFDEHPDDSWGTSRSSETASSHGSLAVGSPAVEEVSGPAPADAPSARTLPASPKGSASVSAHSESLWQRMWRALDQLKSSLLQWCSWLWNKLRSQPDQV